MRDCEASGGAGRVRRRRVRIRRRGDCEDVRTSGRHRLRRSADAGDQRYRPASSDPRYASCVRRGVDERPRDDRERGRGRQARRARLPDQASRLRTGDGAAEGRARPGRPPPAVAQGREPGGARAGISRHARAQRGDAGGLLIDPSPGAPRPQRADHGRDRDGKRARGPRLAPAGAAAVPPLRHCQLLGGRRDAVRKRAVRSRARGVHRRDRAQAGSVRGGPRGDAVSRRDRGAAAVAPGEIAAGARGRSGSARRRRRLASSGRLRVCGDQPRSHAGGGRRPVSIGFAVPVERRRGGAAAASEPPRRHPLPHVGVRRRLRATLEEGGARRVAGRGTNPREPDLGRQRARATQHHRARLHAGGRAVPHGSRCEP